MKNIFLYVWVIFSSCGICFSQQQGYKPIFDNLVPVSPTAFQFLKYTEMPVSEYTGIPNISVPIFTIEEDGVSIPISLSYHAGGIRVSQEASWVGLGWDLTFGSISQMINDEDDLDPTVTKMLPDYYATAYPVPFPQKYHYSNACAGLGGGIVNGWTANLPINQPSANYGFMIATHYYAPVAGFIDTRRPDLFESYYYDSEPDIFKANFFGHSLNFQGPFNSGGGFSVLNKKGYRVERIVNGTTYTWRITIPSGEIFCFDEFISAYAYSSSTGPRPGTSAEKISSKIWMITKIITRNKAEIIFNYSKSEEKVLRPSYSQRFTKMSDNPVQQTYVASSNSGSAGAGSYASLANFDCINCITESFSFTRQQYIFLNKIIFSNGSIDFISSNREDIDGDKKLDMVSIKNNQNVLVKSCAFNYSYFDATLVTGPGHGGVVDNNYNRKRLKLNSLVFNDESSYNFIYNSMQLPKKNSFAQDYWGFYNGNLGNQSLIPNPVQFNKPELGNNGENHSAREEFAKACILEKIVYPTGGAVVLEYQLHEFANQWVPDFNTNLNTISKGYGLRVSFINHYSSDNIVAKRTKYSYADGIAILPIDFFRNYTTNIGVISNSCSGGQNGTGTLNVTSYQQITEISASGFFSTSLFGSIHGVGYGRVIKEEINEVGVSNGKIETIFHNNADLTANSTLHYTSQINISLPAIKNVAHFENGSVKEINYYSSEVSTPIRKISNKYYNSVSPISYGARIFGYGALVHCHCGCDQSIPYEFVFNLCPPVGPVTWHTKPQHLIAYYPIYDIESRLYETETFNFSNGQTRLVRETFAYDQYGQVSGTGMIDNDFTNEITNYKRTYDATGTVRDIMMGANRLADIWAVETIIYPPNTYPGIVKSEISKTYKIVGGDKYVEDQVSMIERKSVVSGNLAKTISYDTYDPVNGNLLQYTVNNIKTSFIWDYEKEYVTAEVKNAAQTEVGYTSFESDGNGNWGFGYNMITTMQGGVTGVKAYDLRGAMWKTDLISSGQYKVSFWAKGSKPGVNTNLNGTSTIITNQFQLKMSKNGWDFYEAVVSNAEEIGIWYSGNAPVTYIDEVRIYPVGALMKTFTHQPLVGVTSECDINSRITYFSYDFAGRLRLVRDFDQNIIRKICYNFAGQIENCSAPIYYNNAINSTFQRNNCSGGLVGSWVSVSVPSGQFSSLISPEDAHNQALVYAQNYANSNGACISPCSTSNCTGEGYKCVNNVCELGVKVITFCEFDPLFGLYSFTYHYEWSDNSWSINYFSSSPNGCF